MRPLETLSESEVARALQIVATEHFTLQGARANTVAETNGRIGIFLGTVSSTLIAVAFVGQMSNIGDAFRAFVLILLPILLFLGAATFGRVLQSAIEDYFYLGGINRIHHFYTTAAPVLAAYFVLSPYDDFKGRMRSMAVAPTRWQMLFTGTAMVGGINSVLAGVFAALLASWLLTWAIPLSVLVGAAVFCASVGAHVRWQASEWRRYATRERPAFPTPH
jgi:hypothetical protein